MNPSAFVARPGHVIVEVGIGIGSRTRSLLSHVGDSGHVVGVAVDGAFVATDVSTHPQFTLIRGDSKNDETASRVTSAVAVVAGGHPHIDVLLVDAIAADVEAVMARYLPLLRPGGVALFEGVRFEPPHGIKDLWQSRIQPVLPGAHVDHVRAVGLTLGIWWKPPVPNLLALPTDLEDIKHQQNWADLPAFVERALRGSAALKELAEGLYSHGQRARSLTAALPAYLSMFNRVVGSADAAAEGACVRFVRTLRYHRETEAAIAVARRCQEILAKVDRPAPDTGKTIGQELALGHLDAGDRARAHHELRGLFERWPADLDLAYHLVATAAAPFDALIVRVRDHVVAEAEAGRRPVPFVPHDPRSVVDHLERHRFVFVPGAFSPNAVAGLGAWASTITHEGCLRDSDGRLGPAQWRILFEDMSNTGLMRVADQYLGPWFAHRDSFVKVLGGQAGQMAWHQDGGTSNAPRRYVTFWLALHACGIERPGIEIVSYPLTTIAAAGAARPPRAALPWSLDESLLPLPTRWAPVFAPGDLLIFHKYVPHATQMLGPHAASRASIDFRLHSQNRDD